ncbi:MAG: SMC-Scp complex subunit ScpB [Patescibacteria group bacterium]
MELDLSAKIEAILFWKAEPQSLKGLAKILGVSPDEVKTALQKLESNLAARGVRLVTKGEEYTLATAPELGDFLTQLAKEELSSDLGRAGLETLTIVLYRGPVTKSEIDYLRGVNSSFTLRHLLVRGLIEKQLNPKDSRSFLYQATFELMSLLGFVKTGELPEFAPINSQINNFLNANSPDEPTKTN